MNARPDHPPHQPSQPLRKFEESRDKLGRYSYWQNDRYNVTVRGDHLMISNADQSARRDWRDFQGIKNR